jgi:chromosome segregation ATPase
MTQMKKTLLIILATVLITSVCSYYFFDNPPVADIPTAQQQVKTVKQQEQNIDKSYTIAMQKLQKENDSLKKVIAYHKAALATADEKVTVLENKVSSVASKIQSEPDTIKIKISDCDSLSREATALIQEEASKDSLCQETISELTSQVVEKDTEVNECQQSFQSLKLTLDNSIQQQQLLQDELKALNKQVKRKTFQSKLLSAGVMVLTGITAALLLDRKL